MRDAGIHTALNYSIAKAAYSEYQLFREFLGDASTSTAPKVAKPAVAA
jgi:hypothetical protein